MKLLHVKMGPEHFAHWLPYDLRLALLFFRGPAKWTLDPAHLRGRMIDHLGNSRRRGSCEAAATVTCPATPKAACRRAGRRASGAGAGVGVALGAVADQRRRQTLLRAAVSSRRGGSGKMWSSVRQILSQATIYDWLLLAAGVLLLLYIAGTWNYDYFSRRGIVARRPRLPFIGNIIPVFFGFDSFPNFTKNLNKLGRGHSIVGVFELQRPLFVVKSPEMLKVITVKEFDHFPNHRNFVSENADPFFVNNIFNLKDQRWKDMRTTLSPAFTTSKIKGMFPLVSQCAQQMVDHLRSKYEQNAGSEAKGLETNMKELFTRLANDVIATVAFGLQCDSLKQPENDFYETGKKLTTFSITSQIIFIMLLIIPKITQALKLSFLSKKATSYFNALVHETIKERKQKNIFRPDMLQLLLQAQEGKLKAEKEDQHESEDIGNRKLELTNDDVTSQAVIFFFAGFESVSTAICFTSYQLSHNPEIQKRLQKEVDDVWEATGGKPTYEDIQGMKYMDMVISETLRMHPPAINVDRECRADVTLPAMGPTPAVTVRKGQFLFVPIMGLHYDEDLWPEPDRFDPERFSDENRPSIKPYSYMPFGQGPRICLGQRFALLEVKLVLAHLLRNFRLAPSPKTKHPLEYAKGFNMTIKGGFWSYLTPRNG